MVNIFWILDFFEKRRKIWKNSRFYRRLWPDRGNTAWGAKARLGPEGLNGDIFISSKYIAMLEGKRKENSKVYFSKHRFLHIEIFGMKSL